MQQISQDGITSLAHREGLRTTAYRDTRGIWTIGVGHTSAAGPPDVHEGLTITVDEALSLFQHDLQLYVRCVNDVINVVIEQQQFDALVSICYNIGTHAFAHSTLVHDINSGDPLKSKIDQDIMMWTKQSELTGRRRQEDGQFNSSS